MPPTQQVDHYASAAIRHLQDATILAERGRHDGAVHLAGFAGECGLKTWLKRELGTAMAGHFREKHDLELLTGRLLSWVTATVASPRLTAWIGHFEQHLLNLEHPERRYWPDGWTAAEARDCVETARRLVADAIVGHRLDDHRRPLRS